MSHHVTWPSITTVAQISIWSPSWGHISDIISFQGIQWSQDDSQPRINTRPSGFYSGQVDLVYLCWFLAIFIVFPPVKKQHGVFSARWLPHVDSGADRSFWGYSRGICLPCFPFVFALWCAVWVFVATVDFSWNWGMFVYSGEHPIKPILSEKPD